MNEENKIEETTGKIIPIDIETEMKTAYIE